MRAKILKAIEQEKQPIAPSTMPKKTEEATSVRNFADDVGDDDIYDV